jgi:hypothetical protein
MIMHTAVRGVTEALANRREGTTECRAPEAMAHNPFFPGANYS